MHAVMVVFNPSIGSIKSVGKSRNKTPALLVTGNTPLLLEKKWITGADWFKILNNT